MNWNRFFDVYLPGTVAACLLTVAFYIWLD
jgi:hypothetical protein